MVTVVLVLADLHNLNTRSIVLVLFLQPASYVSINALLLVISMYVNYV